MTQSNNILQELKELGSSLSDVARINPYTVPDNYFDGLASQVLNRIKALEAKNSTEELGHLSPILTGVSKQMPFNVPNGYFEGLADTMLAIVKKDQPVKEELETISPLLSSLNKQMPYSVPEGYFEGLANTVTNKDIKPVAKVVSITSRKWFRITAAAMIAGIIVLGGLLYFNLRNNSISPVDQPYAWVKNSIKKVDKTTVENFASLADEEISNQSTAAASPVKPEEIKELMKDVSDKEIQDFLSDTPDTGTSDDDVMLN